MSLGAAEGEQLEVLRSHTPGPIDLVIQLFAPVRRTHTLSKLHLLGLGGLQPI